MKNGDTVQFKQPYSDEIGLQMRVLEMRGDRVLVEAQVDMFLKPTSVHLVAELEMLPLQQSNNGPH